MRVLGRGVESMRPREPAKAHLPTSISFDGSDVIITDIFWNTASAIMTPLTFLSSSFHDIDFTLLYKLKFLLIVSMCSQLD